MSDIPVTLFGEPGVGKSLLARVVHERSPRQRRPFVTFDCSVPAKVAEHGLFGSLPGGPPQMDGVPGGALVQADGGTLFLDAVDKLPLAQQASLRRALDSKGAHSRTGGSGQPIDVRIIAASCRDLRGRVADGSFREDLYHRLAAASIRIPSLRQRRADLAPLVYALLSELGHLEVTVAECALSAVNGYAWPGNAHELKGELARALALLGPGDTVLERRHLRVAGVANVEFLPLGGWTLRQIERVAIRQTLIEARGNKATAARVLGTALSTLYRKLGEYDL